MESSSLPISTNFLAHTLNYLGECCNQVNIQSDGPASVDQRLFLGDYKKYGNDSDVYKNIMDNNGKFLYKYSNGHWWVCTNCQYSLLQNLVICRTVPVQYVC